MPTKTQEPKLTNLEEKKLTNTVEQVKQDIINNRLDNSEADDYYKSEGSKRYRCIVTSRRGNEKYFELMAESPANRHKPVKVQGKLGVELEEGLPMYVIERLQAAYDMVADEVPTNQDPNIFSQNTFNTRKLQRYFVNILGEVENPKILGTNVRK